MAAGYAANFRGLIVYKTAREVQRTVFELSRTFPKEEAYSLTSQIRRSSRSIGAQIAEAWAKRRYPNHFISKLTDSDAEQYETQHWVDTAHECGYISAEQADGLIDRLAQIGKMLHSMMEHTDRFCGSGPRLVKESAGEYFVQAESDFEH